MNYEKIPLLRVEVEHLKQTLLTAIGVHGSAFGERLSTEIEKAIQNYDWQEQVNRIVKNALDAEIEAYFSKEAIAYGFDKIFIQEGQNT